MAVHTCNLSTPEVEAEWSEVQSHPQLRRKFEVSLGYRRACHETVVAPWSC